MGNITQLSHTYRKIKVSFKYAPDILFRTFLVRADLPLEELGCVICTMFHAEYEHSFLFDTPQVSYVPAPFMDGFGVSEYVLMDGHTISDLPNNFGFEYDTGESWDFKCRIYKKEEKRTDVRHAILLEGAGAGLWEDAMMEFMGWLSGDISPKEKHGEDDAPWNLHFKTYGELDLPLDLAKEQQAFDERIDRDIKAYRGMMEDWEKNPHSLDADFDDDEEDDFDEEEESITEVLLAAAVYQVSQIPFVHDAYTRLLKKHSGEKAIELIVNELALQFGGLISQESEFSNEAYRKAIEKLK